MEQVRNVPYVNATFNTATQYVASDAITSFMSYVGTTWYTTMMTNVRAPTAVDLELPRHASSSLELLSQGSQPEKP